MKALKDRGDYDKIHSQLIALVASNAAMIEAADASIYELGVLTIGRNGEHVKNPAFTIKRTAEQSLMDALKRLQLDPGSNKKPIEQGDMLDDLMKGGGGI